MTDPVDASQSSADLHLRLIGEARRQAQRSRAGIAGARPADGLGRAGVPSSGLAPDSIQGYELVREIHRGAQGIVYEAVQRSTRRSVAIKVMREGPFASPDDRLRFEREVHLLGRLKHPSVVTIHDSGIAGNCHYFVMDYVRGRPLDAHIAADQPGLRATLDLFATICEAVNAAHLRGIIHRDLKPGNIRIDTDGRPHVLDFGLAKSVIETAAGRPEQPVQTVTGQFIGSLPWASPEQAEGAPDRIDMRTDVYSLGVILYQILTDRFPYEVVGPMRDVLDRILQAEPARPSENVAPSRALRERIDDEVDTIVLKCLAKERERRYQSAGELARDVRRYLAGEPIEAKRDSMTYVLRKQLRRHRVAVAVVAGFITLLSAGLVASVWLWRASEHNRKVAVSNLGRATAAEAAATIEARRAERVTAMVAEIFRGADPKLGGDRSLSAVEALDRGAERTLAELKDDPLTRAALLSTLGEIYGHLGAVARARQYLSQALDIHTAIDPRSRGVVEAAIHLGENDANAGDEPAAAAHYRIAYDIVSTSLARERWHVVDLLGRSLVSQGDFAGAEPVLRNAMDYLRQTKASAFAQLPTLNLLGQCLDAQKKYPEAITVTREMLELSAKQPPYLWECTPAAQNNLAWLLLQTGDLAEAQSLAEQALGARRERLPADHLDIASSLFVLGLIHLKQGRAGEAEPLLVESLRIREAALPADDERVRDTREALDKCQGEADKWPGGAPP